MARIISIVNQKGGTGKSACTANLAVGLAQKNMKVLIVDADPQSDVSAGFGYRDCDDSNETLTALMDAVMKDEDIPSECFIRHQAEGIDIICSNIGLAGTEVQLVNAMSREYVLKQILYTGAFARYGVQFDVYYDSHAAASAHGHQTWECYLADDNGSNEVEVTRIRDVDTLNVTLTSGNLMSICQDRLGFFQKELFSAYNDTKGNLQMFATPVDFNWYSSVTSYYGYRIHPISGANQLHNGMDIGAPEGTKVMAGLTGTVTTSAYNDSYGNYVVIKDSKGYELRYAHLSSRSVSAGASVTKGDEIGLVGNTGNSTGSHLHIELLKNGERLNPIFYLETGEGTGFGGNEYTSEAAQRLLEEAAKYLGTPYVWGGYSPSGFDCSGFVSYCLVHSGVRNTGRLTAQGLYNICTPVSQSEAQPGDLIFFTGTYDAGEPVTHIGIYVGNGQMIHCGHPVQYTSINSPYWQSHFYGFGRW